MIAKADKFEKNLTAMGSGAFGKLEYAGNSIVLRAATLKTPDRGSSVRMYFDGDRNQVMTGRRFDIMGELWLMRQNNAYRVYTHVRLDEELPEGVSATVELTDDAKDVMGLMSVNVKPGELISFTIFVFRNMEFDHMSSLANLVFYRDVSVTDVLNDPIFPELRKETFGEIGVTLKDILENDLARKSAEDFKELVQDTGADKVDITDEGFNVDAIEDDEGFGPEINVNTDVPEVTVIEPETVVKPKEKPVARKKVPSKSGNSIRTGKVNKTNKGLVNEGIVPKKTAIKKTAKPK
jgi:hypothetical protein